MDSSSNPPNGAKRSAKARLYKIAAPGHENWIATVWWTMITGIHATRIHPPCLVHCEYDDDDNGGGEEELELRCQWLRLDSW